MKLGSIFPKISEDARHCLFVGIVYVILIASFFLFFKSMGAIADEPAHIRTIYRIASGTVFFSRELPYLPGYHYTLAALYWLTHFHPPTLEENDPLCPPTALYYFPTVIRLCSTGLSFACLLAFFALAKEIDRSAAIRKTSMFLFFPITFPFFFLIYTDVYSILYILLILYFSLRKRLMIAGLFGILSCLVRQNNILWVAFGGLVAYLENYYPQWRWKDIKGWISGFSVYFINAILLAVFFIWNKGLVIGDRTHHSVALRLENSFYLLFFFFFLFLPYIISKARDILALLRRHKLMWLILIEVFLLYLFFFKADHLYNSTDGVFRLFLHNRVTALLKNPYIFSKILTFLPIGCSLLTLCVTKLTRKSFYLLYPFSVIFLLPNEVVEVRYIFIPLVLFLLFKEKDSWRITVASLVIYWIVLGTFIPLLYTRFFI